MKKIVLITGVSRGIGYALAEKMLNEGFYVIGTSRSRENINLKNENFCLIELDLASPLSIEDAFNTISEKFNHIDILINNAGLGPDLDTLKPERSTFNQTFEVNVSGTVFFTEKIIEIIKHKGILVNISSEMGSLEKCDRIDSVAYRMSKSALNMYTKILSNRLKGKIKVASLHPGWVKTTIAEDNIINGVLTPEESASTIFNFLKKDFKNGIFWDSEDAVELPW